MMNRKYILYIACMAMLAGCSSENEEQTASVSGQNKISITTNVDDCTTTRGTLVSNDNIGTTRIHVDTYKTGTTEKYFETNALYDTKWVFFKDNVRDLSYSWPTYNLDFFAYSPYKLDNTGVTLGTYKSGAPSFTYKGTSPVTEDSQSSQTEYVYAYEANCSFLKGEAQKLTFHHPFALIDFKLDESVRCTIQSVKITGIKNSGTCTYTSTSPYATWTTSGTATNVEIDYTTMSAYSANGGIRYPEDVNSDSHLGGPFIVVPQALADGGMIEVTYKSLGSTNSVTVRSTLNKAVLYGSSTQVSTWVAGNKYIYSLKLNGAANEIFVAVVVTPWTVEGNSETEVQ